MFLSKQSRILTLPLYLFGYYLMNFLCLKIKETTYRPMLTNDKSKSLFENSGRGRYNAMNYRRCGKSGVLLPEISLGLWHNFGKIDDLGNATRILKTAFDSGIVHFDLANNYGPPYGSAEETFGKILKEYFKPFRDELFISTKAGYDMWPGPYGNWGSRKHLISSLDQSLKRMNLDYVDVFYHHRSDPETPLEETMLALRDIVRQGKALYVAISNYEAEASEKAFKLLRELKVPVILHQNRYSLLDRSVENGLLDTLEKNGVGFIAFSPLAQGLLTNKYIGALPKESRAAKKYTYLNKEAIKKNRFKIQLLKKIAEERNEKLSEMAISWLLHKPQVTSVLIGVSSAEQLRENIKAIGGKPFSKEQLQQINSICK